MVFPVDGCLCLRRPLPAVPLHEVVLPLRVVSLFALGPPATCAKVHILGFFNGFLRAGSTPSLTERVVGPDFLLRLPTASALASPLLASILAALSSPPACRCVFAPDFMIRGNGSWTRAGRKTPGRSCLPLAMCLPAGKCGTHLRLSKTSR